MRGKLIKKLLPCRPQLCPNAAAVQFHDFAANKQTQTGAANGAVALLSTRVEFLEQMAISSAGCRDRCL